jgi:hypothetical protein
MMQRREFLKVGSTAAAAGLLRIPARAQTAHGVMSAVLTRGGDNTRSGAYLAETVLTQADVMARGIRKYFSLYMEGDARGCEAQPLIVPSLLCDDGTTRDVVIVCSMNNTVWCYDANTSDILWVKKLAVPVNGSAAIDMHTINDHWGIISTPVIDAATNRLYAVAWTSVDGTAAKAGYAVHVLQLKDGSRVCAPVSLSGVTYTAPNGTVEKFNTMMRKQRSSLLLTSVGGVKTVFFASGTVLETENGAAGWIMAFACASNTIAAAFATSTGDGAGIWMGGGGLCADTAGYIYGVTGNGSFDGVNDFGECALKLQYTPASSTAVATLKPVSWFAPYTDAGRLGEDPTLSTPTTKLANKLSGVSAPSSQEKLPVNAMRMPRITSTIGDIQYTKPNPADASWTDEDLGSAGCVLIPKYGVLAFSGKDGILYVAKTANLGNTMPVDMMNAATNYAKLQFAPVWFTYFPGYGIDAAPQDPSTLDFLFQGKTRHLHATPVVYKHPEWGTLLICGGENSSIRVWQITATAITFLAQSAEAASANVTASPGGMPGSFMCVSANGSKAGTALLWASMPYGDGNSTVTNGRFLCYGFDTFGLNGDGTKRLMPLWDSQAQAMPFIYNKFMPPVVSGGKVFLPTYNDQVMVFGLA